MPDDFKTKIRKKYGQSSIINLLEIVREHVDVIPTGSLSLDFATDVGGIPRGRITDLYGWESSFKSSLALTCVANAQKLGLRALYIDVENEVEPTYAQTLGVDLSMMDFSQPDSAEEALNILELACHTDEYGIAVVDSVAALVPQAEKEGEVGNAHVGLQARLMSQSLRKIKAAVKQHNIAVLFINQFRALISTGWSAPGTPKEQSTGGNALKFYSGLRIRMSAATTIKKNDQVIGRTFRARVEKNKVGIPFRTAEFSVIFGKGIDTSFELLDIGERLGVVAKKGAFYSYGDTRLGQGRENSRQFLEEHPDMAAKVETDIRASFGKATLPVVAASDDGEESEI